jgi:hypothetical protein
MVLLVEVVVVEQITVDPLVKAEAEQDITVEVDVKAQVEAGCLVEVVVLVVLVQVVVWAKKVTPVVTNLGEADQLLHS